MGSIMSTYTSHVSTSRPASSSHVEDDDDLLDGKVREEDIAQFPYVEFTGRDSITCPSCQGTGCIPTEQVNELVALIPYSDQRLQPQRTKCYVVLSVLLCLLICGLVVFFLFPRTVLVQDGGIRMVQVWFDKENDIVNLAMTSTLHITNSNFYSISVDSLISQVQYMNTVIGTQQQTNVSVIQPLSEKLVNFTVKLELGGILSYLYNFCTLPTVKVHNIVVFVRIIRGRGADMEKEMMVNTTVTVFTIISFSIFVPRPLMILGAYFNIGEIFLHRAHLSKLLGDLPIHRLWCKFNNIDRPPCFIK